MTAAAAAHPAAPPARALPGDALARFFEARGLRTFEAGGALWAEARASFCMPLPFQLRVDAAPGALDELLRAQRVAGLRYPVSAGAGIPNGLFVCDPRGFGLDRVERRHRAQVKKGLAACELREVDPDELRALGLEATLDTLARQGRGAPEFEHPARFARFAAAVRATPEVKVHGAFVGGRLAAWIASCRDGGWLHLLFKFSRTEDLAHRTNPALDFWILSEAAKDPRIVAVSNGFASITAGAEGLHRYKRLMGYALDPFPLAIRLHPALAPLLATRPAAALSAALARAVPGSGTLELAARALDAAARAREAERRA